MKAPNKIFCGLFLIIFVNLIGYGQDSLSLRFLFKPALKIDANKLNLLHTKPYSIENLPVFCRLEEMWSKNSGLNVRFRVGDVQYVDKLEGKK